MKISESGQIPHQLLRPFFGFWDERRGRRPWPRRQEITLDDLRRAAANAAFCRIERPYRDLDSLHFVNVGTAIEQATGQRLTGMTVGQLLRGVGSSPEFTYCFSEYGQVATEGCCTYNEGNFPWPNHSWLSYRRLVMPLGEGDEPDALFVVIDLNAVGLGLTVPQTLRAFDGQDAGPAQPWKMPALQILPGTGTAPRD
ncbi:MAG: hypothetical protein ACFB13_05165 [Kiloniellaceae bacterium]